MRLTGSAIGLSTAQHQFLIDHYDETRPITHDQDATMKALIRLRLVTFDPPLSVSARPTHTRLTDQGRYVLCSILGWMADSIDCVRRSRSQSIIALLPKQYQGHTIDTHRPNEPIEASLSRALSAHWNRYAEYQKHLGAKKPLPSNQMEKTNETIPTHAVCKNSTG